MVLVWSISVPLVAGPHGRSASDQPSDTRSAVTTRSASGQPTQGEWRRAGILRNSDDKLTWVRPQPDRSIVANRHPSFLQSLGDSPRMRAEQPLTGAPSDVAKASFDVAVDATRNVSPEGPLVAPPALMSETIRQAAPLGRSIHSDRRLRFAAAQQPSPEDASSDVFDDVLGDLSPSDEAEEPSVELPALDDGAEDLPSILGPDRSEADSDGGLTDPLDGGGGELPEDVFGQQPDALPELPPSDDTDLPSDLRFDQPATPDEFEPDADLLSPGPAPPQMLDEQDSLEPEDARPLPDRRPAGPLREPGDEVVNFNGRNCPAELADLQEAWERLRRTPIRSISLDITPSVEPSEYLDELAERPQEAIKRAPSRVWRDRQGETLAEGKMEDFRNGKVLVRSTDGDDRWLSWYELSNEDLCFVSAWWGIPSEFNPEVRRYELRNWTLSTFTWTASALCHKPLYFEEVQLERYGHSAGPVKQAMLSGAHFFGNIFLLPYHIGLNPPNECQYALGYYRPGDCAPWMVPAAPLSSRAFRFQMGALVSGLTLLP